MGWRWGAEAAAEPLAGEITRPFFKRGLRTIKHKIMLINRKGGGGSKSGRRLLRQE